MVRATAEERPPGKSPIGTPIASIRPGN
jgi:hypothetical protein